MPRHQCRVSRALGLRQSNYLEWKRGSPPFREQQPKSAGVEPSTSQMPRKNRNRTPGKHFWSWVSWISIWFNVSSRFARRLTEKRLHMSRFLQGDTNVVSAGMDAEVCVSNISQEKCLKHYHCHHGSVRDLAVEPYTPHVFWTASEDGTCRQFDTRDDHFCVQGGFCGKALIGARYY